MSESIISNTYRCVVCGMERDLHRHHIYGIQRSGGKVKRSIETGRNRYGEITHWTRYTIE